VSRLKSILERFTDALSCVDQCFIADGTLEQLPAPSQVGKTAGGRHRLQQTAHALGGRSRLGALPPSRGFTASELAHQVRGLSRHGESEYGARRAAYDLKKLRGKQIVCRIAKTQRYEPIPHGLRTMAALVVLRDKVIKPLLAAARQDKPGRAAQNPAAFDTHYHTARLSMQGIFHLGLPA
jgi:hypothetical protein